MAIPANWPQDLTALANRVMQKLGEVERFTDITTDTTDNAVTIRDCSYDVIRNVQADFRWPELETFLEIETEDDTFTDSTGYDFSHRFSLPDDYLRPLNEELYSYRIREPYVYAALDENLPFHYIRYEEDVTQWSTKQFNVVLFRLSEEVCLPITQSDSILAGLIVLRKEAEDAAHRVQSYNHEYPNQRHRGRGELARLRNGRLSGFGRASLRGRG